MARAVEPGGNADQRIADDTAGPVARRHACRDLAAAAGHTVRRQPVRVTVKLL